MQLNFTQEKRELLLGVALLLIIAKVSFGIYDGIPVGTLVTDTLLHITFFILIWKNQIEGKSNDLWKIIGPMLTSNLSSFIPLLANLTSPRSPFSQQDPPILSKDIQNLPLAREKPVNIKYFILPGTDAYVSRILSVVGSSFFLSAKEEVNVLPNDQAEIGTGMYLMVPEGYFVVLSSKNDGLPVQNQIILPGNKEEIKVKVHNNNHRMETVMTGRHIAVATVVKAPQINMIDHLFEQ